MYKDIKNKKLFGTDGIRGLANQYPILPDIALRVGQALGILLKQKYPTEQEHTVVIGKDTRLSGYMLEQAMASGLNSVGVWVQLTGPLPTPGIGFLAQNMRVSAGVVISASHNPYNHNGMKIFFADGFKISFEEEKIIEDLVFSPEKIKTDSEVIGRTRRIVDAAGRYIVFAKRSFPSPLTLKGFKIVLDCANGSSYKVAPAIFSELGAEVIPIGNKPNGFNINKGVGALYHENISKEVLKHQANVGISLDGDADRVVMVDEKGRVLNGDHILGICAIHLHNQNKLKGNHIVATHLSNSGLEETLKPYGIKIIRSDVGDRNVVELMRANQVLLGGESSGHIIFLDQTTTGDGCIAALNVLAAMKLQDKKLSEFRDGIVETPQVSINIPIKQKKDLESLRGYKELLEQSKNNLKNQQGKILVRYSGTEPIVRVFVEAKSLDKAQQEAQKITHFLEKNLS